MTLTLNIRTLFAPRKPRPAPVQPQSEIGLYVVRKGWRAGFIGRIIDTDYTDAYAYKVAVKNERGEISIAWCEAQELTVVN